MNSYIKSLFVAVALFAGPVFAEETSESLSSVATAKTEAVAEASAKLDPLAPDNATITAEQLLAKVRYMLIEMLGLTELPNIAISDMMPGGIARGPYYLPNNNTMYVPLNGVRNIGNWATQASELEVIFSDIRSRISHPQAMTNDMLLGVLAHEMGHYMHRVEIMSDEKNAQKRIIGLAIALMTVNFGVGKFMERKLVALPWWQAKPMKALLTNAVTMPLTFFGMCYHLQKKKNFMTPEEAAADIFALDLLARKLPADHAADCCEAVAQYLELYASHALDVKRIAKICTQERLQKSENSLEKFLLKLSLKSEGLEKWFAQFDGHMPNEERCALFREYAAKLRVSVQPAEVVA